MLNTNNISLICLSGVLFLVTGPVSAASTSTLKVTQARVVNNAITGYVVNQGNAGATISLTSKVSGFPSPVQPAITTNAPSYSIDVNQKKSFQVTYVNNDKSSGCIFSFTQQVVKGWQIAASSLGQGVCGVSTNNDLQIKAN